MYSVRSARSEKAASSACVMFDVASTSTFGQFLSESSCVSTAFTTRTASDGSVPFSAAAREATSDSTSSISTETNVSRSSTSSRTLAKTAPTSLPDSENHLEKSECAFSSIRCPVGKRSAVRHVSLCASARHSDVLPVPGGPWSSSSRWHDTRLVSTEAEANASAERAYERRRSFTDDSNSRLSQWPSSASAGSVVCCQATLSSSDAPIPSVYSSVTSSSYSACTNTRTLLAPSAAVSDGEADTRGLRAAVAAAVGVHGAAPPRTVARATCTQFASIASFSNSKRGVEPIGGECLRIAVAREATSRTGTGVFGFRPISHSMSAILAAPRTRRSDSA
mmetsp:Transcript_15212/g.39541  ORF Transcript_15212/g.39541 Transcript_15212/m.39541 type:complete len:336 (+) Transcript_15212:2350-3357(+)